MKYVILVSGKLQTGKNQFAEYLIENFKNKNMTVESDLFAKSLKDGCKKDFKTVVNYLNSFAERLKSTIGAICYHDNKYRDAPDTIKELDKMLDELRIKDENFYEDKTELTRLLLQLYGTEIFRDRVDKNWWAKQVRDRAIKSSSDVIVVTDTRFPNEIEVFYDKSIDNDIIKVITVRVERNLDIKDNISSHESEIALDDWNEWNYIIENNGTLKDLQNSSDTIVDDIINNSNEIPWDQFGKCADF